MLVLAHLVRSAVRAARCWEPRESEPRPSSPDECEWLGEREGQPGWRPGGWTAGCYGLREPLPVRLGEGAPLATGGRRGGPQARPGGGPWVPTPAAPEEGEKGERSTSVTLMQFLPQKHEERVCVGGNVPLATTLLV